MAIYQRGNKYILSIGSGEGRQRVTYDSRDAAEEAELEYALEVRRATKEKRAPALLVQPSEKPKHAQKTLQDACDRTFRDHWRDAKSIKTHTINSTSVLAALGKDTKLVDIDDDAISDMIDEWEGDGNSGSTVNRKLSNLSMMLKTAYDARWLDRLPKLPRRREGAHRIRWMTEEEERSTLQAARHMGLYDLADFIIVAADTGFRRSELLGFNSADFIRGLLCLHAGTTKNDLARSVPATNRVKAILTARSPHTRPFEMLTVSGLRRQWDQLREALGKLDDPHWVPHMLRHTCASRLVQRGVPLAVVQQWMGHSTIQTTLRYAHLSGDNMLEALVKLQSGHETVPDAVPEVPLLTSEFVPETPVTH